MSTSAGRPVPSESLHATLVFIGSVPEQRIPELEAIGARVAGSFSVAPHSAEMGSRTAPQLIFDRIEYWQKPQIICGTVGAESADGVAVVGALVGALRKATVDAGFTPDLRPFRPHVTVARKVARPTPTLDMHSVPWSCTGFALVDSRTGAGGAIYSVINSWALDTLRNS